MITTLFGIVSFCKYSVLSGSYFLLSVILFVCQKGGDDMQKEKIDGRAMVRPVVHRQSATNGIATPRADTAI